MMPMGLRSAALRAAGSSANIRENKTNLQGRNKLVLPVAKTTTYGLKSTCYIAAKAWNSLPDTLRSVAEFARFRNELRKLGIW